MMLFLLDTSKRCSVAQQPDQDSALQQTLNNNNNYYYTHINSITITGKFIFFNPPVKGLISLESLFGFLFQFIHSTERNK